MQKLVVLIFMSFLSLNALSSKNSTLHSSLKERKYGNEKIEVLRVKGKIESPAKDFISIVQDELDDCYKLLRKKEDISSHISKVFETKQEIQSVDSVWPIHIYVSEIEFLQKHNTIETSSFETGKMTKKKENKKREYSGYKESINNKKPKIKELKDNNDDVSICKQIDVNNKDNEDLEDSTCNLMSVSTQQTSPITEQAASDTDIKENISEESDKSGKTKMGFIIIIAILVLVAIRWIRSNMHLFFGGILVLLIFLIYGGVKNPAFFLGWGNY